MNKTKKIKFSYYSLKEAKCFSDGSKIETSDFLRKISPQINNCFTVETVDFPDIKRIFTVKRNEVILVESIKETWTKEMLEQQEKERKGEWFQDDKCI